MIAAVVSDFLVNSFKKEASRSSRVWLEVDYVSLSLLYNHWWIMHDHFSALNVVGSYCRYNGFRLAPIAWMSEFGASLSLLRPPTAVFFLVLGCYWLQISTLSFFCHVELKVSITPVLPPLLIM